MHDDFDDPLRLPAAPAVPARPAVPIAAALVPVVGAVVLWRLTGSAYALWFAALGPLMAAASFADGWRGRRRITRRARRDIATVLADLDEEIVRRHERERRRSWRRTPDVAGFADDPDEIWRVVPGREDMLVVGRGRGASMLRLDGDPHDADARALRRRARTVEDVPVLVPLTAGIAVCGPPVLAAAVTRALALQVCLAHAPGRVRAVGRDESGASTALPHAEATRGAVLFVGRGDRPLPADVDIPIVQVAEGAPPPPRCAAVVTLTGGGAARLDHDGVSREVRVEAVSKTQADLVTAALSARAATLGQRGDAPVTVGELPAATGPGLAAAIGVGGGEPFVLDLVVDGPHAVVIGVTGSGKSELLTTWIAGLCRGRSPQQVALLLVDFKGGRTFDALAGLPHVTGVLTDLDEAQALRAVESLRAEVCHRERVLASLGARDVAEAGDGLGRLVIVVDEYAALVAAYPQLHDLFADIAARGRALGMHLVLASQRAGGAFRDGVLANAPLRIAFRVTDAADARAVLGTDDAAHLPGSAAARGTALVRRAADAAARTVRVARCDDVTLQALCADAAPQPPARRPWLPPLPPLIGLADARQRAAVSSRPGAVVIGVADEPESQRQPLVTLAADAAGFAVLGGPGSGRTTVLRAVATQAERTLWVPGDLEAAWDAVVGSADATGARGGVDSSEAGTIVLIDDVDALLARFPADHGAVWLAAIERAAREARAHGIVLALSASRVSGPLGRVLDLLPQRAILPLSTRADHVAAGGEAVDFTPDALPGRGRWGRRLVQFVTAPEGGDAHSGRADDIGRTAPRWQPAPGLAGSAAVVLAPGPRADAVRDTWTQAGLRVVEVARAGASDTDVAPGTVVVGAPDEWLAQWRALADARARGELVVDAACAAEYRTVTGRRELPPYARPGAGRAWAHLPDGAVRRVTL